MYDLVNPIETWNTNAHIKVTYYLTADTIGFDVIHILYIPNQFLTVLNQWLRCETAYGEDHQQGLRYSHFSDPRNWRCYVAVFHNPVKRWKIVRETMAVC